MKYASVRIAIGLACGLILAAAISLSYTNGKKTGYLLGLTRGYGIATKRLAPHLDDLQAPSPMPTRVTDWHGNTHTLYNQSFYTLILQDAEDLSWTYPLSKRASLVLTEANQDFNDAYMKGLGVTATPPQPTPTPSPPFYPAQGAMAIGTFYHPQNVPHDSDSQKWQWECGSGEPIPFQRFLAAQANSLAQGGYLCLDDITQDPSKNGPYMPE